MSQVVSHSTQRYLVNKTIFKSKLYFCHADTEIGCVEETTEGSDFSLFSLYTRDNISPPHEHRQRIN